jgi:hypothetical protein
MTKMGSFLSRKTKNLPAGMILDRKTRSLTNYDNEAKAFKVKKSSRLRVNLPHIGNRKCIKFILQRNLLNKTQGSTFLSRDLREQFYS